ncbi:MAG: threonine synthase [Rhodospirillaceae bacterium]|nr:threonine synthase [Rhodospirillaceae bacterium]
MHYISTRGEAPALAFDDVLLTGLARDGGLYVPESWPQFSVADLEAMRGLSYSDLACRIMTPFLGGTIPEEDFAEMVAGAYASFESEDVVPMVNMGDAQWLMELFHGPTLAFKDVALQLMGRLFDYVLQKRGERVTIVGATSGDTGSAAIEACKDRAAIDIVMLYPFGRVSEVQQRQMTTVTSANVHNVAIEGTFDDCQDLVKACFNDLPFRDEMHLSAVNSINWARIMAQIVYYFRAGLMLGAPEKSIGFTVPTGNFGNIYAGYAAHLMGLSVEQFVVASNRNDILFRFFEKNAMEMEMVVPTLSPSMDIQVSSNFERLLFDLFDRNGAEVSYAMAEFRDSGKLTIAETVWEKSRERFDACRIDDVMTSEVIDRVYREHGMLIDPHTAVAMEAACVKRRNPSLEMVSLATAHPAKFPDAVKNATGITPELPVHLSDLLEREERFTLLSNQLDLLQEFIRSRANVS